MRRATALGAALAAAIAVTVPTYTAYAAGGHDLSAPHAAGSTHARNSGTPTQHRSKPGRSPKPAKVTPYSPPAAPDAVTPSTRPRTITPSAHFHVEVDPRGKKAMDSTWPAADEIFTSAELHQVLPKLTAVKATDCSTGTLPDGGATTLSTTCTLSLRISGEPSDDRSKLMINVRGFGLPQQIGAQWTKDLARAKARSAKRPGLYTFYANKSLGVSAAFTDGTTTEVLLQHGHVAGEVWFSGIGFTTLTSDYLKSRTLYRQQIVPALIQLLGAKLTDPEKAAA